MTRAIKIVTTIIFVMTRTILIVTKAIKTITYTACNNGNDYKNSNAYHHINSKNYCSNDRREK